MAEFSLDPSSQLFFQEITGKLFQRTFKVQNQSDEPLAYKVKTTSPKHFCVRPNIGIVPPNGEQEIDILLQPRKDKFLVMATKAPNLTLEQINQPEYWSTLETNHKDLISEKRIKCVFTADMPTSDAVSDSKDKAAHVGESSEKAILQANERIKKLEILLAETKRGKSGQMTSGIVPLEIANAVGMVNSVNYMFPPLLVLLIAIAAFLSGFFI